MNEAAFAALPAAMLALAGCGSEPVGLPRDTQTIAGMTIYIGVIPAELVRDHPTAIGDPKALHGGAPKYGGSHHLVVALFDDRTGARITDARIHAGVAEFAREPGVNTPLEPMEISGAMSYGNFFPMPGSGDWRIRLEIRRTNDTSPARADFAYGHPGG